MLDQKPYSILDGATGATADIIREQDNLWGIARDHRQSLEKRLEAYEDIIDSEVGDTSMVRARNIEREVGLRQIYLKFEGGNPTGTQKDRIAFSQAMDALRRGYETITMATCGNYGVAMALATSFAGLHCRVFIPETYHSHRIKEMRELGAHISHVPGDYENAVNASRQTAADNKYYDANPGGDNTDLQFRAYGQIAHEIYDELRDAPHVVAAPVSNGTTLAGTYKGIPIYKSINAAATTAESTPNKATHLVVGLAPDGGRLKEAARSDIRSALSLGLNIDSGLHDFLSEDKALSQLAARNKLTIRDIRKSPPRDQLHFFSGKIEKVTSLKIAVLGTDSAVGKRTTAWLLVQAFETNGFKAEMIGTGQTAWMQGAEFGIVMDSLINDFVSGEIEHAIYSAWEAAHPDVIVIEGQGSLMNPAYPGGFEILAAGRPDLIILQHAPARKDYDGFPGYPIHPLPRQIQMLEGISGKPVAAITINHEGLHPDRIDRECKVIRMATGLPTFDVLKNGADDLTRILIPYLQTTKKGMAGNNGKH